ncbi:MAG: homoserine kinase [Planctomycetota bacterium]
MSADVMKVKVPASTANLGSGFDVVGLALQMHLEVELEPTDGELVIENSGQGADQLPTDKSHLIYRLIAEHAGDTMPAGMSLRVKNGIPLTRGFGSSAAATAAGVALGKWIREGTPPARERVLEEATKVEGHPDNISACILGGLTVSGIVEEEVVATSLRIPYGIDVVVIIPNQELSTRKAREALPLTLPRAEAVFNLQRLGLLLSGLFLNKKHLIIHGVQDQIHQARRYPILPSMGTAVNALNEQRSCLGAFISGAGPAIAAFTKGDGRKLGEIGVAAFAERDIEAEYRVLPPDYLGLTY